MTAQEDPPGFDHWALVEIMGHQRAAGRVTEQKIGGAVMLRIDIPKSADAEEFITQYVNTGSLFRLTPVTEEVVRAALRQWQWQPPSLLALETRVRDYADD